MAVPGKRKLNVFVSDTAWANLIQMGHTCGYVRGGAAEDRPRGISAFVSSLGWQVFEDGRPEYMRGTGQWCAGVEPFRQRCLHLRPEAIRDLGLLALEWEVYPFKTQRSVLNGWRREMPLPVLHGAGATPNGSTSVLALVGPFLEAVGLGYLSPIVPLAHAPPSLYQGPSKREVHRRRKRRAEQDVA